MIKKKYYILAATSSAELGKKVSQDLNNGSALVGGVSVTGDPSKGNVVYAQAMWEITEEVEL